jgi:uncharacterized membrane protein (UPF0182 family)
MPRIPRGLLLLLAIAIFAGIPSFAEFYTDWLWYREVGYADVFLKSLSARATTGMVVGGLVFAAAAPPARVRDRDAGGAARDHG